MIAVVAVDVDVVVVVVTVVVVVVHYVLLADSDWRSVLLICMLWMYLVSVRLSLAY